jgi:hypothetical protein
MRVPSAASVKRNRPAKRSALGVLFFVWVVVVFTSYHFALSGVPVFSEDVETARFDFTSSGLFGIPGRMFLFGLPFAVLLVSLAAGRELARVSRALVYFVWASYSTASLLAGFKGGLITVLMTMLLARTLIGRPISLFRLAVGWRAFVVIGALVYCAAISFRYKSLGLSGPGDVFPYLAARATTSAAAPGHLALLRFGTEGSGGMQFVDDAAYFVRKYAPFMAYEEDAPLPLDKTISAALYHTPISRKAFIVPVTVGAFPEFVANFGALTASLAMFLVGVLLSYLVTLAQTCDSAIKGARAAFTVYVVQIYMLNGNLIYTVFNLVLMNLLLVFVYWLCCVAGMSLADWDGPLRPESVALRHRDSGVTWSAP